MNEQATAIVLAALRLYQNAVTVPDDIEQIATDHGRFPLPTLEEIDALCERLNTESEPDFDQEFPFHCPTCQTTAHWSMNNAIHAGTPICENCGDDMVGGSLA